VRGEELRKDKEAFAQRRETLDKAIDRLTTISDLRRALSLTWWRDDISFLSRDQKDRLASQGELELLASVDQEARKKVGDRLAQRLQQEATQGDATNRLAVAQLLADMGATVRATTAAKARFPDLRGYARQFTPLLAKLTRDESPAVRQAAAQALGKINPDVSVAVPTLKAMLETGTVEDRRAAADALGNMQREIANLATKGKTQTGVEATPQEVIEVGAAVVPVAGLGVEDRDVGVRRLSLATLEAAGMTLTGRVLELFEAKDIPPKTGELTKYQQGKVAFFRKMLEEDDQFLAPLVKALADQGERLATALTDPDPQARLLARRALEWMANARVRLLRRWQSLPAGKRSATASASARGGNGGEVGDLILAAFQNGKGGDAELLRRGAAPALTILSRRLRDPNPVNRRAAVDFLEMLENDAAPAVPALIKALADPDLFVRWAAARTLGRIDADLAAGAVPALACLLQDRDLDVRLTAAATLEAYGPVALPAAGALAAAARDGDADLRRAAMYALMSIGTAAAEQAVPALVSGLTSEDPRVRKTAAEGLGRLGPAAQSAVPVLRRALQDEDQEVRQAASDALLNITPVPK
jgi:HEAT repeat protein